MRANESETWELAKITGQELDLETDLAVVFLDYLFRQAKLFDRKEQDYGPTNISGFGELGILVRVSDKFERLKNLKKTGAKPANESVDDTWMDIANYAPMALMCRNGDWPGVDAE